MFPDWAHVGAKVICINHNPMWKVVDGLISEIGYPLKVIYPTIGETYTIREIGYLCPNDPEVVSVWLQEIHNLGYLKLVGWENSFGLHRFKPLINLETDIEMFNEILKDIKIEEDA